MSNHSGSRCAILVALAFLIFSGLCATAQKPELQSQALRDLKPAEAAATMSQLGALPLGFVFNHGQNAQNVLFESKGAGGSIAMLKSGVVLTLPVATEKKKDMSPRGVSVGVRFLGAEKDVHLAGSRTLPGKNNYFYGQDKTKWRTNASTFADITYQGLYPGIDLLYNGTSGRLKGTYTVSPGADPSQICWEYVGATKVTLDKKGDLVITLPDSKAGLGGVIREEAPVAWQVIDGKKNPVDAAFELGKNNQIKFKLGAYDKTRELVIDPFVIFSTFMGGNGTDHCIHLQMDLEGHVYITGRTHSNPGILGFGPGWPVTQSSFDDTYNGEIADAFVMKLDKHGTFQHWSGYLGGGDPVDFLITGGADWAFDLQLDANGDVHVIGWTESTNFPITADAMQPAKAPSSADAFYTVISSDGSQLLYSTYVGGSGFDFAYGLALRDNGWAYIVGWTDSPDYPTTSGAFQPNHGGFEDGFFTVIQRGMSTPVYSTYFGDGTANIVYDVGIGPFDLAFFAGETYSTFDLSTIPNLQSLSLPQPVNRGGQEGFLAVMDPGNNGADDLLYVTYLGGSADDYIYALDVERATGEVYLTGITHSVDFPVLGSQFVATGTADSFVTKFFPQGLGLFDFKYSVVLGTPQFDSGLDVVVHNDAVFYSGITEVLPGDFDAFWCRFSPTGILEDGVLIQASFFDMALGIAVNDTGVAICGYTQCINNEVNFINCFAPVPFPVHNPFMATYGGGSGDGFVSKRSLN